MRGVVATLVLLGCSQRPLPFPEETRPPSCGEGLSTCLDGPKGTVASTQGPDDCFADAVDGELWPTADGSVVVCGDLARVFGESGL